MRQSVIKKTAAVFTACILSAATTAGMGMNVFAAAAPLYSFDYDGHHINTYATYSTVDGDRTDGFRYFVKNGNLVVVDNDINSVADGMFIHYDSGDSYIAALTNGGRLVSMGTVDLPSKLKNFSNKNIDSIASNVEDDTHTLIVNYANGATVAYDVLTGEELFRTDAEKNQSITSYIKDTISDLLTSNQSSSAAAKAEAEAVIDIMNSKGYSLEQLLNNGVFSSAGNFKEFLETGSLGDGNTSNPGSTGDAAEAYNDKKTAAQQIAENGADPGSGIGESQGDQGAKKNSSKLPSGEAGGSNSAGTDIDSSYTVTAANSSSKNTNGTGSGKTSSSKTTNKTGNSTSVAKNSTGVSKISSSNSTGVSKISSSNTDSSKTGSVVFVHESTGTGKSTGESGNKEIVNGSGNGKGEKKTSTGTVAQQDSSSKASSAGSGLAGGTDEKGQSTGADQKGKNADDVKTTGADGQGTGDGSKEAGGGSGTGKDGKNSGKDSKNTGKDGKITGEDGKDGNTGNDGNNIDKDGKKIGMKSLASTDYVSVYNADTNGYDIYSVDELMENPEKAKSENEKLGAEDNNKIAQLLSVKEDETSERGMGLYAFVIAGVALLLVGILVMMKNIGKKGEGEA